VLEFDPEFLGSDQEHLHDQSVTSVGFCIEEADPLNIGQLQEWISKVTRLCSTLILVCTLVCH
jgi:hypothetical protein